MSKYEDNSFMENQRNCFQYNTFAGTHEFSHLEGSPIAFFCAEYGIEDMLPIYAGGLGVLAGDFVLEAGKQGIPFVAIGMYYRKGFASTGNKEEEYDPEVAGFSLLCDDKSNPVEIDIEVDHTVLSAQVWVRVYGSAHLFLLDVSGEKNGELGQKVSEHLYSSDFKTNLLQDFILGTGGVKLLRCLDISPSVYHLNEGHASFVALALAVEYLHDNPEETNFKKALKTVSSDVVATKHTILTGAGLFFSRDEFYGFIDAYLDRHKVKFDDFFELGTDDEDNDIFSTTRFLLKFAHRANAVSIIHAAFEKRDHPHSDLIPITNGVHVPRWRKEVFSDGKVAELTDEELWKLHVKHRSELVTFAEKTTGTALDPEALTIVWARRFASYKRPGLIFSDIDRLANIVNAKDKPVQFIISGSAAVADKDGQELIKLIKSYMDDKKLSGKIVYLPDYSIPIAKKLIAGADVWLATPERGKEASGTSGMKAGMNGALQMSTSDGWLEEVDWSDMGWMLDDANTDSCLYAVLEKEVVPMFYERNENNVPYEWVRRMRGTMNLTSRNYSTTRMLEEYLSKLYFPGAEKKFRLRNLLD